MQARKHASEGIHPGFETQGRRHQKPKTGVSVAPQKGLVSYKIFFFFFKKSCLSFYVTQAVEPSIFPIFIIIPPFF